jgi:RNA polymerase sigma-70 factor (ECF subfamily)
MIEPWIRDILLASQNGDTGAFEKLVETYQGYAFSLASRFLGNEEDAQDVVQETFIRVWKHLSAFDYRCKFTTWMYRIVTNLCLDRAKSLKRKEKTSLHNPMDSARNLWENVTEDINLEDKNIKEELAAIITGLAAELTPRQRAVFVLRDLQDVSIAEAAQILGISKGSVKSNLCHARQNIRDRLEQLEKKQG